MSHAGYAQIQSSGKAMKSSYSTEFQMPRSADPSILHGHGGVETHPRRHVLRRSQIKDIAWSASLLTLPLLTLTVALLAMIFGFQVKSTQAPFPNLAGNHSDSIVSDAFYVNLPATFLIFVASWMSSLAPISIGLAMSLALYPVADRLYNDSMNVNIDHLLSPYQLATALKFAAGSIWNGLFDLAHYRMTGERRRLTQGRALASLTRIGCFVLALTLLVLGADTWLHVVTKTVPFVQLTEVSVRDTLHSYSLLSPNCTTTDNSFSSLAANNLTCTIDPGLGRLQNGVTAIQALNNESDKVRIYNNGPDPALVYIGIASSQVMYEYDYTAQTLGVRATCRPMTQTCGLGGRANASNVFAYNCHNGSFTGKLLSSGPDSYLQQAYFYDYGTGNRSQASTFNPYEYAVAFVSQSAANLVQSIREDPDIFVRDIDDSLAAALLCNVTAYNVEYDMINGSISRLIATPSNISTVNVFTPGLMQTSYGWAALQSALQLASVTSTSAQDLADRYALAYSKVAISIGAGSLVPTPAVQTQRRTTILVAKVPKAPVLLLITVNLVFVCLGLVLAVLALRSSRHAFQVQLRFGIAGIVAAMFEGERARQPVESEEELFDESRVSGRNGVVGIRMTKEDEYDFDFIQEMVGAERYAESYRS